MRGYVQTKVTINKASPLPQTSRIQADLKEARDSKVKKEELICKSEIAHSKIIKNHVLTCFDKKQHVPHIWEFVGSFNQ